MFSEGKKKGFVFDIQKFSIHDGEGMRTLVFMKGCPLTCIWCSNPESQSPGASVLDVRSNCIQCGKCVEKCPIHAIDSETFEIDRSICDNCGLCCETCYANAKKIVGKWMTVKELIKVVEKDRIFYRNSGGGLTIGGGEPLTQPEFVEEVFHRCKKLHIHTAIETCGYAPWETVKNIFSYVDQVLYDIKHMDSKKHRELTGVGNERILDNAEKIVALNKDVTFRIPLIPGYNDSEENIRNTGEFIKEISRDNKSVKVEILPFHNFGADKYEWIGKTYKLRDLKTPQDEVKLKYDKILQEYGCETK